MALHARHVLPSLHTVTYEIQFPPLGSGVVTNTHPHSITTGLPQPYLEVVADAKCHLDAPALKSEGC